MQVYKISSLKKHIKHSLSVLLCSTSSLPESDSQESTLPKRGAPVYIIIYSFGLNVARYEKVYLTDGLEIFYVLRGCVVSVRKKLCKIKNYISILN